MRVKKLDIFGFKSFATRQTIVFGAGVTSIVGPNGCGKSNVVDALRWVMGEQNARQLRGGNMQDIIFCGSEKKAPLGYAEVTLTIDNHKQDAPLEYNHFSEIEITRRLYKTGESEYEINRQKARLRDISEFFLGTGVGSKAYSIIEQGRISDVISAKPADRRLIIEEAAGITKYKAKRATAERRMEATRQNLSRIIDIKNEVDKRVSGLLREKEKLDKVMSLKNRARTIDIHLAAQKYLEKTALKNFFNRVKYEIDNDINDIERDFAILEQGFSKVLESYSEKHNQRRVLEDLETQHNTTLELLKKDLEYNRSTLNDNQLLVKRLSAQLQDIDQRTFELDSEIERIETEEAQVSLQQQEIDEALLSRMNSGKEVIERRQENLNRERDLQRKIIDAATKAARLQTEITVLRQQDQEKKLAIEHSLAELKTRGEEMDDAKRRLHLFEQELGEGSKRKDELTVLLDEQDELLSKERSILSSLKSQHHKLNNDMITLCSRRDSLREIEERCEWSDSGILDLLSSDKKDLVKGIVADLIEVKPGHEDVVETCLAHMLDAALISNGDDLLAAASFLREQKSARASFCVLGDNSSSVLNNKYSGLSCLADFITIRSQGFAPLSAHFSRYFLADDLSMALAHWPRAREAQADIVTLGGEMLLSDGRVLIFGQDQGKGVLKRKNELKNLDEEIASLQQSSKDSSSMVEKSESALLSINKKREAFLEDLKSLNFGIVRLEETVKQKSQECIRLKLDVERLQQKNQQLHEQAQGQEEKVSSLSQAWSDALSGHKNYETELEVVRGQRTEVESEYESYQQEIKKIEIHKASVSGTFASLKNAKVQAHKSRSHFLSQKNSFLEQIDEKNDGELKLKESIRQTEKRQSALNLELEQSSKMLESVRQECRLLSQKKSEFEMKMGKLRGAQQDLVKRLHTLELNINDIENDVTNLCDRIRDKYREDLIYFIGDFHQSSLDEKAARREMDDVNRQVERMGAVNENASLEYEEFNKRASFLENQVSDLTDALSQLESAIKKINKTTKMRFLEAFNNINGQFSQVFPKLFNGGKAELILSDEEDLLNCGVDIMAKPPGKNISSIELMSGGEKALTAISLIMAIFLIKPSPFCLLDEVDAPLDEANVARFSQLIKEMSELSQFIVITHNRKTMETSDQLYGVTMEEAGQSKIVSVHVQQAFESFKIQKSKASTINKATQLYLDDVLT